MLGWMGKALIVDLSSGGWIQKELPLAFCKEWLGGKGFNLGSPRSLFDSNDTEEDDIFLAAGLLVGTPFLGGNIWCLGGKGSFTGKSISTYGTGHWGSALKYAGFDQLVLKRTASFPSLLVVNDQSCWLEPIPSEMDEHRFTQKMKERFGVHAQVLYTAKGLREVSGFMGGDAEEAGVLLSRRNLRAIVVYGNKTVQLANPTEVLKTSKRKIEEWKETGLPDGQCRCSVCHGRCSELTDFAGFAFPEIVNLWLSLGLCPQFMQSGLAPSLQEILSLLEGITGQHYSIAELFGIAQRLQSFDDRLCVEGGGYRCGIQRL